MKKQETPSFGKKNIPEGDLKNFLLEIFEWELFDYNLELFESGIAYLGRLFPENDPLYEPYFKAHAISRRYWMWWKSEWACWQEELLAYFIIHDIPLVKEHWMKEMRDIIYQKSVDDSFYIYLKLTNSICNKI